MIISKFREIIGPNRSEGNPVYLSDVIFHSACLVENKQSPLPPPQKKKQIKNKSVITSCDRKTTTNWKNTKNRKTMEIASIC